MLALESRCIPVVLGGVSMSKDCKSSLVCADVRLNICFSFTRDVCQQETRDYCKRVSLGCSNKNWAL